MKWNLTTTKEKINSYSITTYFYKIKMFFKTKEEKYYEDFSVWEE